MVVTAPYRVSSEPIYSELGSCGGCHVVQQRGSFCCVTKECDDTATTIHSNSPVEVDSAGALPHFSICLASKIFRSSV